MIKTEWRGFKGNMWQIEVNLRDFIQNNYTCYDGDAMPAVEETQYVRHVRFEHPMRILMDGKKQEGAVLIPKE